MKPPASVAAREVHDARFGSLRSWLQKIGEPYDLSIDTLRPASVDASFRRYFRIDGGRSSVIAMDAPPANEDSRGFVRVASLMQAAGLHVPEVLEANFAQGFLLLSDLGSTPYLAALNESNADDLFSDALNALILWQLATREHALPSYDEALLKRELQLFPDWYVARHLQRRFDTEQEAAWQMLCDRIVAANLAQPRVFVHRDYMPRNLMVSAPNPGVIDFQDAVIGPIAYDVVSLFRDAFISWDEQRVNRWSRLYWERASASDLPVQSRFDDFWRDFEWMGVQRHLKVLGIFARIRYRDGKPHYLEDAPRFVCYLRSAAQRDEALKPLLHLFDQLTIVCAQSRTH